MKVNQIKIYEHEKFGQVRTVLIDSEVWFVLSDICNALHLSSPHKVAERLDEDEKGRSQIPTLGGMQNMVIVNESGLYAVILRSDKGETKKFRKWITNEVLPSIRKNGCYMTPETIRKMLSNPDFMIILIQELAETQAKNQILLKENSSLKEKCSYLDTILQSETDLPITVIAKDYGFSARKMNRLLHFLGVQYRMKSGCWVLYARYENYGYTRTHTYVYDENKSRMYTCWTQKGRKFLYELLKKNGYLPLCEWSDDV